jgi:hypothetical protein
MAWNFTQGQDSQGEPQTVNQERRRLMPTQSALVGKGAARLAQKEGRGTPQLETDEWPASGKPATEAKHPCTNLVFMSRNQRRSRMVEIS